MNKSMIRTVHVVFKTHLDIGFTDMGQKVLDRYLNEYIPLAMDIAEKLNVGKEKKFIWTIGTYLIDYYFKNADQAQCVRMEEAIRRGDICWHGLMCSTHTELLDEDLFRFSLSRSDELDRRFGKKTISAKMSDVPGHTRAIVSMLAKHRKEYIHLGVNSSSMVPEIPGTFVWRAGDRDVIVQYSFQYGAPCYVEGMEEVLEFVHTRDNMGPQSVEFVQGEMCRIQKEYPNAKVIASTMDAYADSLKKFKENLPVIEEEIGDTWIHGIASDPLKIMRYRALVQLKNQWEKSGWLSPEKPFYCDFMTNLILVAEHTWGLDYKKYLADFTNWEKKDFQAARKKDITTLDFLTNRNAGMFKFIEEDLQKYGTGEFQGSYKKYESSHKEQMEYIWNAVKALPDSMQEKAVEELNRLDAYSNEMPKVSGERLRPHQYKRFGSWEVAFGGNGDIISLSKDGKPWIRKGRFGRLVYSTYNAIDCVSNYYSYNRSFRKAHCWAEADFSKPGVEFAEGLEHREYLFGAKDIYADGQSVIILLEGDEKAVQEYGMPALGWIRYQFGEDIRCSLSWNGKDANRLPEALWFDMDFDVENPYRWKMNKMGHLVSPMDVLRGGNRKQHCVEEMLYDGADGRISVKNIHSPLISVDGRWLYGEYRELPELTNGFAYCLFNNKWGTNFKMWCEDNCTFEYMIQVDNYK